MSPPSNTSSGHSAKVAITLQLKGHSIPVAQLGPGFFILDAPSNHPPSDAIIVMRVDQNERRWTVHLPDGISSESKRVNIAAD